MKDQVNVYKHQYCTCYGIWLETPAGLKMTYTIEKQKLDKEFLIAIQQLIHVIMSCTSWK